MIMRSLIIILVCTLVTLVSGQQVMSAEKTIEAAAEQSFAAGEGVNTEAASALVDINSADAELLSTLPGIGPKTAEKITAYRTANGPFNTVDDLLNISGIGSRKLEKIRSLVTIS